MKFCSALLFMLLAGCAAAPADHYQPFVLGQAARDRQAIDASTARIFAERAKRIAPQETRLGREAGDVPAAASGASDDAEPPLPALWGEARKNADAGAN